MKTISVSVLVNGVQWSASADLSRGTLGGPRVKEGERELVDAEWSREEGCSGKCSFWAPKENIPQELTEAMLAAVLEVDF